MSLTTLNAPRPTQNNETPRRYGWIAGILCFCFFFAAGILSISASKSSTAAIGYVFLPFYAVITGVLGYLAGWCAGYFLVWYRSPAKTGRLRAIAAALVPVMMTILAAWTVTASNHRSEMREAARNPNTAPEDLERLAESTNEYVLGDLAGNPKISESAVRKLASHGGYLVEWGLAHNRNTPADILSRLAGSANENTRGFVAANPNAPADILAVLSRDRVEHVRWSVAQNPSTPRSIIEVLLGDANETVRRLAGDALRRR